MSIQSKIQCAVCGAGVDRKSSSQKYCAACSVTVKREGFFRWRAANLEKAREDSRKWRVAHLEKAKERDRQWRAANPERAKKNLRKWQAANPERVNELCRKWRAANPDKVAVTNHARRRSIIGSFTADELKAKFEEHGNKCVHCGTTEQKLTVDHITPLKRGGTNNIDNVQPLCQSCNSRKGARFVG